MHFKKFSKNKSLKKDFILLKKNIIEIYLEMLQTQSFHPKVIISNHFDEIKFQIDINTESLLEKLENLSTNNEEIQKLNELRDKQISANNEIEATNLNMVKYDKDEYACKWQSFIDDVGLDYNKKIDMIKENLIYHDCILMEDPELISKKSLWITPSFFNKKDVEFLRYIFYKQWFL